MIESAEALTTTELPLKLFHRGKVRDTYEIDDDRLLMISTDRLSAYDHVLPSGIPDRGKVLTQLSIWWFGLTHSFQENHLISGMIPDLPDNLAGQHDQLNGRFMIVRRAQRIDIECVVRGYISGSGWAEYQEHGTLAGEKLRTGLLESDKLDEPRFTPATKSDDGHDENITYDQAIELVGEPLARRLRDASLELYRYGAEVAEKRGVILADTKFEFGLVEDRVVLIDEVFTPDSSRYWDAARYQPGSAPPSYDKQFVRDWLNQSGWDRDSAPPALPADIVEQTRQRYLTAYQLLTGRPLFEKEDR
ncbi:MAG TPA: phosphoribosylaminoimidazolesuccinocarboxamide synthase [Candidatus Dormibacteraeota bacterium]